jgi:lysophospholipase L1-like esterase
VRSYNEAARRVLDTLAVPIIDLYPLVAAGPALLAPDGAHLTPEGNEVTAAAVAAAIVTLL